MKYPIHIALLIFVLLISLSISVGCNRDEKNEASQQMNIAENLLDTAPDSALIILDAIKEDELYNREMKARYSLLKSIALDKNYIDTTTFDVLQPKQSTTILKTALPMRGCAHYIIRDVYFGTERRRTQQWRHICMRGGQGYNRFIDFRPSPCCKVCAI